MSHGGEVDNSRITAQARRTQVYLSALRATEKFAGQNRKVGGGEGVLTANLPPSLKERVVASITIG